MSSGLGTGSSKGSSQTFVYPQVSDPRDRYVPGVNDDGLIIAKLPSSVNAHPTLQMSVYGGMKRSTSRKRHRA